MISIVSPAVKLISVGVEAVKENSAFAMVFPAVVVAAGGGGGLKAAA